MRSTLLCYTIDLPASFFEQKPYGVARLFSLWSLVWNLLLVWFGNLGYSVRGDILRYYGLWEFSGYGLAGIRILRAPHSLLYSFRFAFSAVVDQANELKWLTTPSEFGRHFTSRRAGAAGVDVDCAAIELSATATPTAVKTIQFVVYLLSLRCVHSYYLPFRHSLFAPTRPPPSSHPLCLHSLLCSHIP